ncbi:hypothetical protein G4228_006605 [Cervus hanglu yarkandensis]|nr:hypothetical protein G4228_006605 [Cervus hanglu yarkandensis]
MADSVVSGNLMMAQWSSWFLLGVLFRGYLGCHLSSSIFGCQKVDNLQIFSIFVTVDTFQHCFLGLQSLCFGFDFRRGRSFLLHLWCHLHEKA